jgi:hypothetical protein
MRRRFRALEVSVGACADALRPYCPRISHIESVSQQHSADPKPDKAY